MHLVAFEYAVFPTWKSFSQFPTISAWLVPFFPQFTAQLALPSAYLDPFSQYVPSSDLLFSTAVVSVWILLFIHVFIN